MKETKPSEFDDDGNRICVDCMCHYSGENHQCPICKGSKKKKSTKKIK